MKRILGMVNALVDIMIKLEGDQILEQLELPKGSMQLVDENFAARLMKASGHLEKQQASGGSASNTIHGLAKLGASSAYIGKIGNDEFG